MNRFWVDPHAPLPQPEQDVPGHPGLIALGLDLSAERLLEAYTRGMFPWYSEGQPVLWWSPDPRMVVFVQEFRPSRSLRRLLTRLHRQQQQGCAPWQLTLDRNFEQVMRACAGPREARDGTWITEDIIQAYTDLHHLGLAHSIEVWERLPADYDTRHAAPAAHPPRKDTPADGRFSPAPSASPDDAIPYTDRQLIAGLYGVSIGRMFFGESMFTRRSNASKCAFAALMQLLRQHGFLMVDCQQTTRHLSSLGGRELPRTEFLERLPALLHQPAPEWSTLQVQWPIDWPEPMRDTQASPTAGETTSGMQPEASCDDHGDPGS
ncbi:MAG: leucyl/phenylalanyl-tRNA--protein transferase [Lautropia sp.]|nr:leucyl/phenylalanyl-tRNA--protein transferase [Lautropia sp.]